MRAKIKGATALCLVVSFSATTMSAQELRTQPPLDVASENNDNSIGETEKNDSGKRPLISTDVLDVVRPAPQITGNDTKKSPSFPIKRERIFGPIGIPNGDIKPLTSKEAIERSAERAFPDIGPSDAKDWQTIDIVLPGQSEYSTVPYYVENGMAVVDGDMVLGPVDRLDEIWTNGEVSEVRQRERGASGLRTVSQPLNATTNSSMLWPSGIIPYEIGTNLSAQQRQRLRNAARYLTNTTNLTLVEYTIEKNYVSVIASSTIAGAGKAQYGMKGGQQFMWLKSCSAMCIVHEFLHSAGIKHEQSRTDRDEYIEVIYPNIRSGVSGNFDIFDAAAPTGDYDYESIMHYSGTAFSKPGCTGDACITIRARKPLPEGVTIGLATRLSTADIEGVNQLYRVTGKTYADTWGAGAYPTSIAFGDVDGNGRAEVAIGRRAASNNQFHLYSDDSVDKKILFSVGANWASADYVTDVAFGDVDGDGRDEIGITRRAGSHSRFYIYDDKQAGFALLKSGGAEWGSDAYATTISFGDIDGDGKDEFVVGRKANSHGRYYVFDDAKAPTPFKMLAIGGSNWGAGNYTTAVAFGDVDGDGDMELGVTRKAGSSSRYSVLDWENGQLTQIHSGGSDWDVRAYGTAIAFGNVDNDIADEMLVGRRAPGNGRYYLIDDRENGFKTLQIGGEQWSDAYYPVSVAFGDIDADGKDEFSIARNAGKSDRLYVYDDAVASLPYAALNVTGLVWPLNVGATDMAMGDADGDGDADFAVSRRETSVGRARFEVMLTNIQP